MTVKYTYYIRMSGRMVTITTICGTKAEQGEAAANSEETR